MIEDESNDGRELRRLAVEVALSSTFKDVRNPYITWEDLKQLITVCMPDHVQARFWFKKFREFRNNCTEDLPPRDFPDVEILRDEILVGVCERVNFTDPLTIIAAMNYNSQIYFDFNDYNPKVFIKPFLKHNGILIQCSGLMGSGKTDFALKISEMLLDNGFVVITNIRCSEAARIIKGEYTPGTIDNLYMVTRMTDLLLQLIKMRKDDKNVVIVFDETSIFYNRQSANTRENIALGVFVRLIRKFSASCIFIEQLEHGLATITDSLTVSRFHKMSQKKLQYSTSTLESNYNLFLKNTPKTNIDFDTLDLAGFSLDINFKKMMEKIDIDAESKMDDIVRYINDINDLRDKFSSTNDVVQIEEKQKARVKMIKDKFNSPALTPLQTKYGIVVNRRKFNDNNNLRGDKVNKFHSECKEFEINVRKFIVEGTNYLILEKSPLPPNVPNFIRSEVNKHFKENGAGTSNPRAGEESDEDQG